MSSDSPLLRSVSLGALALRNRIVMAPMTRHRARPDGVPHPSARLYYEQRAGAGLVITEGVCISPTAVGGPNLPGIWTEEQVAGWRQVVDAVHGQGGVIVAQLWHYGRAALPEHQADGYWPVGPSPVAIDPTTYLARRALPYVVPKALEVAEIAQVVREYAAAAKNARRSGFDGVELHGANGYLIDQFLHSSANRRTDAYGGSAVARCRFLAEVTEATCAAWGEPGRVGVRLSPTSAFQDMRDPDPAALFEAALAAVAGFPLAYLHVVEPGISGALSTGEDRAGQLDSAWVRGRWPRSLIATGGNDRERALTLLREGQADAVGFARLFLANPDLPTRLAAGSELNEPDRATFYGGDDRGYLDYPTLEARRLIAGLRAGATRPLPTDEPLGAGTPVGEWELRWAADRLREELAAAPACPGAPVGPSGEAARDAAGR